MQENNTGKERENLKICFIADGKSMHTQRWIEYFADCHEVHLITYDPMGISIPGVTEHVVGFPKQNLFLSFWPRHLKILRLIKTIHPDLIHAHFVAKYGLCHLFFRNKPLIVHAWVVLLLVYLIATQILEQILHFCIVLSICCGNYLFWDLNKGRVWKQQNSYELRFSNVSKKFLRGLRGQVSLLNNLGYMH